MAGRGTVPAGRRRPCAGRDQSRSSLEEGRLDGVRGHPSGPRDQRPDLPTADIAPATQLDALQPPVACPATDRRGREMHVGGSEDRLRLGERDPVVGRGHPVSRRSRPGTAWRAGCHRFSRPTSCRSSSAPAGLEAFPPAASASLVVASASLVGLSASLPPEPSSPPEPSVSAFAPDLTVAARRSFLAQPEPLKWIAAAVIALRTGPPPQIGQVVGPSAWTPWMTSKRWPHAAQT